MFFSSYVLDLCGPKFANLFKHIPKVYKTRIFHCSL